MYARRAHCPNMQFQLQEELTAQSCNLLLSSSFLYPPSILSTRPITIRPCRPGHEPQIQMPNLKLLRKTSAMKFPSLLHYLAQICIPHSLLLIINHNPFHDKGKFPSFISIP